MIEYREIRHRTRNSAPFLPIPEIEDPPDKVRHESERAKLIETGALVGQLSQWVAASPSNVRNMSIDDKAKLVRSFGDLGFVHM